MEHWISEIRPIFAKYDVVAAYLFGSRAKGEAHIHSDFDLAILFKNFYPEKHNLKMRIDLTVEISQRLNEHIDLVFLQSAPIAMRYEILATGKVIYCFNDDIRTDFEDIVYRDYLDFKPFLDQFYKDEMEAVRDGYFFA